MELNQSISHSSPIAIRETNYRPGVLVQTQSTGITFDNGVRYATGTCPKCGTSNSGIYFPKLKTQDNGTEVTMKEYLQKHGANVRCCNCGIPYKVEIE